jgi:hypothetical protein
LAVILAQVYADLSFKQNTGLPAHRYFVGADGVFENLARGSDSRTTAKILPSKIGAARSGLLPEHRAAAPALAEQVSYGVPAGTAKQTFLEARQRLPAQAPGIVGSGPAKKRFPAPHVKPAPGPPSSPACPVTPAHIFRPFNANRLGRANYWIGGGIAIQVNICRPTKHDNR